MKPTISEFSYGYVVTEELIRGVGIPLTAAPVFPSLIDEGRQGGYDVKLDFQGTPLFLQFKLSDYINIKNCRVQEFKKGLFNQPFYRMHLRSSRYSNQHQLLIDLENLHPAVYYVAPTFHEVSELNKAYVQKKILKQSVFISPSAIGQLPDKKEHHIAFQFSGNDAYFLSTPVPISVLKSDTLGEYLSAKLRQDSSRENSLTDLTELSKKMINIVCEQFGEENLQYLPPIQSIAYLARLFFNCEMFMLRKKTESSS